MSLVGAGQQHPSTLSSILRQLRARNFTGSVELHFHRGVPKAVALGRPERIDLLPSREGLDPGPGSGSTHHTLGPLTHQGLPVR